MNELWTATHHLFGRSPVSTVILSVLKIIVVIVTITLSTSNYIGKT